MVSPDVIAHQIEIDIAQELERYDTISRLSDIHYALSELSKSTRLVYRHCVYPWWIIPRRAFWLLDTSSTLP